jgi:hypothetical protein
VKRHTVGWSNPDSAATQTRPVTPGPGRTHKEDRKRWGVVRNGLRRRTKPGSPIAQTGIRLRRLRVKSVQAARTLHHL